MYKLQKIQAILKEEGTNISKSSLSLLIKKFNTTGSIEDHIIAWRPQKLTLQMVQFIDNTMAQDIELSARKLHSLLKSKYSYV